MADPAADAPRPASSDDDHELLRQFRQLAARALADPTIDVAQAGPLIGMSERSFYRKFKELTGRTPAAYLREFRLEEGHRLLAERLVASVEEAAFRVGFEDVAYFARLFYRRYRQRASELLR